MSGFAGHNAGKKFVPGVGYVTPKPGALLAEIIAKVRARKAAGDCTHMKCKPSTVVNRIEFRRVK